MSDEPKVYEADLSDFQLDEDNANLGTERGTYMIDKSLTTVGAGRSIVSDKNGKIPAGNKTLQAAIDVGLDGAIVVETDGKKLVVVKRTDWDMADEDPNNAARRYAYFDNRSGEVSLDWSPEQLLADLGAGAELGDLFFDSEIEEIMAGLAEETEPPPVPEPETDKAEELQAKWQVESGQVWQAGNHFVICGDCRETETWERLLSAAGVEKVNGVFTSPPYAEQRKQQYGGVPVDEYVDWWEAVQDNVRGKLAEDGSFFVNIKPHCQDGQRVLYVFDLVLVMVRRWGWRFVDELCWVHSGSPGKVFEHLKNQFEPTYQFSTSKVKIRPENAGHWSENVPQGGGPNMSRLQGQANPLDGVEKMGGIAYPGNVISIGKNQDALGHGAAFPVALPDFFIRAYSDPDDVWLDPFCGSGTTICAAHKNDRRGLGIEKLEKYVSVVLERLKNLGLEPRLLATPTRPAPIAAAVAEHRMT